MKPNMKKRIQWAVIFVSGFAMMGCGGKTASQNHPPVADAGTDQTVDIHTRVYLDGNGSTDSDGDALTYEWRLSQTPDGSGVLLQDRTQTRTSFTPDKAGRYIVTLQVIDEHNASSEANVTVTARDVLVFPFSDPQHGIEPWTTNGLSSSSTRMLKDINSQPAPVYVGSEAVRMGSRLYFLGTDRVSKKGLWMTDGTASGTRLVKPFTSLSSGWGYPVVLNDRIYFVFQDEDHGRELWVSDGTEAGTHMLLDINPADQTGSYPGHLTLYHNAIYFAANDGVHGRELWVSDGTAGGTQMLKDINGGGDASPNWLTVCNNLLFFSADDGTNGTELWKSNGTAAGTVMVQNIRAGSDSSRPQSFACQGSYLYFAAYDGSHGTEPWRSDGTIGGATMIQDIYPGINSSVDYFGRMIACNGKVFFAAEDGTNGKELWSTTGATAIRVKDIRHGSEGSNPNYFVCENALLYFTADDGLKGEELWVSDGTFMGTRIPREIHAGTADADIGDMLGTGGRVYFAADDGTYGRELWTSDGTEAGTYRAADLIRGAPSSHPMPLGVLGSDVYLLTMEHGNYLGGCGMMGILRRYDPVHGTVQTPIPSGAPTGGSIAGYYQRFLSQRKDGDVFLAADDGVHGYEMWYSDKSASGTQMVEDAMNGNGDSQIQNLYAAGNVLYYGDTTPGGSWQLRRLEDPAYGIETVFNLFSNSPGQFAQLNGRLFFRGATLADGGEWWRSDGTLNGTAMLKEIRPGPNGTDIVYPVVYHNRIFFGADDGTHGSELWVSDGTEGGTTLFKDIWSGSANAYPNSMTVCGSTLFFRASTAASGSELWRSDGTSGGTVQIKDIRPGTSGSEPRGLMCVGSTLFFSADDGTYGRELWRSDGTSSGTRMAADLHSGSFFVRINLLGGVGNRVIFATDTDGSGDMDLWVSDGTESGTVRLKDFSNVVQILYAGSVNGRVVVYALSKQAVEAWSTDGTREGTLRLAAGPYALQ